MFLWHAGSRRYCRQSILDPMAWRGRKQHTPLLLVPARRHVLVARPAMTCPELTAVTLYSYKNASASACNVQKGCYPGERQCLVQCQVSCAGHGSGSVTLPHVKGGYV